MKLAVHSALLSVAVVTGLTLSQASEAGIKCWTNNENVRECGNVVPPEYAQKSYTKLNKQGIAVSKTQRAKSKEELDAERRHAAEVALARAERDRIAGQKANRDRILLQTFATEDDILLSRDGQLAALDSQIQHIEQVVLKIKRSILELEGTAAKAERRGDKVSENVLATIDSHRKQLEENAMSIEQRRLEQRELEAKYALDLARYRELRGQATSGVN